MPTTTVLRSTVLRATVLRATVLATASLAVLAPASAAPPERIVIDEAETFEFPLCGIPTSIDFVETGTLTIRTKGRDRQPHYTLDVHGSVVNTNLATGRSVRLERDLKEQDVHVETGPGDLLTITGHSIIHENDYNSDGSLAFRTYGRQAWTIVVDTKGTESDADDEVVSEEFGDMRGRNDRADVDFCAWYAEQTA